MDIVIVGAGEVGSHLADILSREAHRVSVIDSDAAKVARLTEVHDCRVMRGDGTRADVLTLAGVPKADLFVAVTNNDRVNMLACLSARKLGAGKVILRLKDLSRVEGYHYFYKRALGFDVVLSTDDLASEEIVGTVREQHALEVENFAGGRVQLRRLRLDRESELTSGTISDLRLPPGLLITAVSRKDRFFVPTGDDALAQDDQLYLIGRTTDLDRFELLLGDPAESARKQGRRSVVIMGGGGVGCRIASKLDGLPEVSVRILERDAARAREIASTFSNSVMVLVGDSTDLDLLMEEHIGDANIFIATTADDERNMVACQLARSLGVTRTIAMVNKAAYRQIYDLLGVDLAISPRILCANRILRFVRSSSVDSVAVVADGRGEVLELEVHLSGGKEKKVKALGLPRGSMVGAILREDEVLVPTPETTVKAGDHVILFTLSESLREVEGVFRGAAFQGS